MIFSSVSAEQATSSNSNSNSNSNSKLENRSENQANNFRPITHEYQLENGLKVIIREDHRAPVLVSQVWYRVGSSYEHNGITGISHMLEHMMFKGTEKYPIGSLDHIFAENGGQHNAFTGNDYTAYYQVIQSSALEKCLALESDRMRNLKLLTKQEDLDKERQVVMEERRWRTDDQPEGVLYERLMAMAHMSNPYHHPVIGWMNDIENYTIEDLSHWYEMYYAPNNAILVIVGDVTLETAQPLIQKYFGPLLPAKIQPRKPQISPEPNGKREVTVSIPAENASLLLGFNVPNIYRPGVDKQELFALEIIAYALSGGNSARFNRELVRNRELAAGIGADYGLYTLWDSLFMISATPNPSVSLADLEAGIFDSLEQLKNKPLESRELQRIINNVIARQLYKRDSIVSQALEIGSFEVIGCSWREADQYPQEIQSISAEAIQKVAQKYLTLDRLVIGRLVPKNSSTA